MIRNSKGQFTRLKCVHAHDRCEGSMPCPYCEPEENPRPTTVARKLGAMYIAQIIESEIQSDS